MNLKLKSVRVASPVPFNGPATTTLTSQDGTLEFDDESQLVIATPSKSSAVKEVIIPLGNVVFFEVMDEKVAAAAAKVPVQHFPEKAPEPVKGRVDDTIKLTKGSK